VGSAKSRTDSSSSQWCSTSTPGSLLCGDVLSGATQGSPLSPTLCILAAQQPLAGMRQLQANGRVDGTMRPNGLTPRPNRYYHGSALSPPARCPVTTSTLATLPSVLQRCLEAEASAVAEAVLPFFRTS
jgi:hypothetical protein